MTGIDERCSLEAREVWLAFGSQILPSKGRERVHKTTMVWVAVIATMGTRSRLLPKKSNHGLAMKRIGSIVIALCVVLLAADAPAGEAEPDEGTSDVDDSEGTADSEDPAATEDGDVPQDTGDVEGDDVSVDHVGEDEGSQEAVVSTLERNIQGLQARSSSERIRAVRALGELGDTDAVEPLSRVARTDPLPAVRAWAIRMIYRLGTTEGMSVVREAGDSDNDERVRETASVLLRHDRENQRASSNSEQSHTQFSIEDANQSIGIGTGLLGAAGLLSLAGMGIYLGSESSDGGDITSVGDDTVEFIGGFFIMAICGALFITGLPILITGVARRRSARRANRSGSTALRGPRLSARGLVF